MGTHQIGCLYGILAVILFVLPLAGVAQEKPGAADGMFSPLAWKRDTLGMNHDRARMKHTVNFFEYYLSPNYRKQSATRSRTELRNGTLKEDLGSHIILEFDEEGKVSGARALWSCG